MMHRNNFQERDTQPNLFETQSHSQKGADSDLEINCTLDDIQLNDDFAEFAQLDITQPYSELLQPVKIEEQYHPHFNTKTEHSTYGVNGKNSLANNTGFRSPLVMPSEADLIECANMIKNRFPCCSFENIICELFQNFIMRSKIRIQLDSYPKDCNGVPSELILKQPVSLHNYPSEVPTKFALKNQTKSQKQNANQTPIQTKGRVYDTNNALLQSDNNANFKHQPPCINFGTEDEEDQHWSKELETQFLHLYIKSKKVGQVRAFLQKKYTQIAHWFEPNRVKSKFERCLRIALRRVQEHGKRVKRGTQLTMTDKLTKAILRSPAGIEIRTELLEYYMDPRQSSQRLNKISFMIIQFMNSNEGSYPLPKDPSKIKAQSHPMIQPFARESSLLETLENKNPYMNDEEEIFIDDD